MMMFLYFAQHPVDVVLVEVGIGGCMIPQTSSLRWYR